MHLTPEQEKIFRETHLKVPLTGERLGDYEAVIFVLGPVMYDCDEKALKKYFDRFKLQIKGRYRKVFSAEKDSEDLLLVMTPPGTALASQDFERYLCHAEGVKFGVGVGRCGALQRYINRGDVILPRKAVEGDEEKLYYQKKSSATPLNLEAGLNSKPDLEMAETLLGKLEGRNLTIHEGRTYTTDYPFFETPDLVGKLEKLGVLGIDMEMANFFAVADFHGKRVAGVFLAGDNQTISNDIYFLWPPIDVRRKRKREASNFPELIEAATETLLEYL